MDIKNTSIQGCYQIIPRITRDKRGSFVKVFQSSFFEKVGLCPVFKEEYNTISNKGVLRGLHFQTPPHDHDKLVSIVYGEVIDVVVDLRKGSLTYGEFEVFSLSGDKSNMLYIPSGLAHGFYVVSDEVMMNYKVTSEYAPDYDEGILWNTIGYNWPDKNPVLSERDKTFKSLANYKSPFE